MRSSLPDLPISKYGNIFSMMEESFVYTLLTKMYKTERFVDGYRFTTFICGFKGLIAFLCKVITLTPLSRKFLIIGYTSLTKYIRHFFVMTNG